MNAAIARSGRRTNLILCILFLAIWQSPGIARAESPAPDGFRLMDSVPGVSMYRKDYSGGSPDYVQVLDLSRGAELRLLSGQVAELRSGQGAYRGNDARFRSKTVQAYYEGYQNQESRLFCAANGSFFYMPEYPTRLPFPLKRDGQILTDGYAANQFAGKKLILELWPGRADIQPLSAETLYQSTAPNILGGLSEDANKRATHYTGRTFVGVQDRSGDGLFDTLLVFNSRTATQAHAAEILRSFGAQKVMMLDGGGSTQLTCGGKTLIASERLLPQAIAILSGDASGKPLTAMVQAAAPTESLPASNLIAAAPLPTALPFNPDDARPAVIFPGSVQAESSPAAASPVEAPASAPIEEIQSPPSDVVNTDPSASIQSEGAAGQPPAENLLSDYLPQSSAAAQPQNSLQSTAMQRAPGQPIYDLSDILSIPMFMLPVVLVIFAVLIRRQFLRYGA